MGEKIITKHTLEYPYTRTTGPVIGVFLTALRDGKILGIKIDGKVHCPPLEFHPETAAEISTDPEKDFVEVGPGGTVQNHTWVAEPSEKHPLQSPFAFAQIQLDGADTTMVHALQADSPDEVKKGMRVQAQWVAEPKGAITDIYFVAEEKANQQEVKPGEEPVKITEHLISINIVEPLHPHRQRFVENLLDAKITGQRSPVSGKVYVPSRGYDNMERVRMDESCDVAVEDTGTVVGFTELNPVQYYGQEEVEPYVRCSILLDGADQPMLGIDIRDIPVEDFRMGMRLKAIWKDKKDRKVDEGTDNRSGVITESVVERWEPTGEPDLSFEKIQEHTW